MRMGSAYPALALTVLAAVLPASTNTVPLEAAFQGKCQIQLIIRKMFA